MMHLIFYIGFVLGGGVVLVAAQIVLAAPQSANNFTQGAVKVAPISTNSPVPTALLLRKVEAFYKTVGSITADVHKKNTVGVLQRVREQKGRVQVSHGHLRLEWQEPKALTLLNASHLWSVQYRDSAPPQILKMSAQKLQNELLIAFLSGRAQLYEEFRPTRLQYLSADKTRVQYHLIPKKKKSDKNIVRMQIELHLAEGSPPYLSRLVYWDALENKVEVQFSSVQFGRKLPARLFQFHPPKGSEVTEL